MKSTPSRHKKANNARNCIERLTDKVDHKGRARSYKKRNKEQKRNTKEYRTLFSVFFENYYGTAQQ